ncbi:hypothetical protein BP5796_08008 [Coleophoma crateriformis]|uniref:Uncharacterized protein n=2 Tax=Coleophoma TaxID=453209 RepID=A0A3D8QWR4_9HELO|nr:hypothetical protein BP6252_09867 [Coleophoma cylindrospora]RDW71974.1 hypothetical protein BP5796_08008 [Coleophoma crateriformis]
MATAETVDLGEVHAPKEESLKLFDDLEVELKTKLQHLRHESNKHEPEYFKKVASLSDKELTTFSSSDLKEVRIATSAYGMHLFGKVLLPKSSDKYFMFRAFIGGEDGPKFHSIRMDETEMKDGDKVFNAIFEKGDELVWFDT